jgi:hypothetical protein
MRDELDIPMPAMTPSYRVAPRRRPEMDPATKRLATFAGVIGGALILLVGVWSFTGHRHSAGVPLIAADTHPLRVKPADPGGMQVDGADQSILSGESEGKSVIAPGPETPAPQALQAEDHTGPATPPAVLPSAAPPPPAAATTAAESPKPAAPAAAAKPTRLATAAAPGEKPAASPRPVAAAAPSAPAAATAHPGSVMVQLAALETEDAAKTEWQRLEHKYGDLLAGHEPTIMRTEHAGKTFWRLRTSGFTASTDAVMFCERVKAKGGGCAVAKL